MLTSWVECGAGAMRGALFTPLLLVVDGFPSCFAGGRGIGEVRVCFVLLYCWNDLIKTPTDIYIYICVYIYIYIYIHTYISLPETYICIYIYPIYIVFLLNSRRLEVGRLQ